MNATTAPTKIKVVTVWTDNEFAQVWQADDDGQLVCAHAHIEREPAQHTNDPLEQNFDAYDVCIDCGETLEIGGEDY